MNPMEQEMAQLLAGLAPEVFQFEDQSHLHVGHAGAREGGHFSVLVVSQAFADKNRIARQRMVQKLLQPLFHSKKIHALSISAQTPSEYFN